MIQLVSLDVDILIHVFVCNVTLNLKILLTLCMQDRDGQAIIIALRSISKGEEV